MTLTTTPNQLTDGLERLLRPLNKIHVPVHELALVMSHCPAFYSDFDGKIISYESQVP